MSSNDILCNSSWVGNLWCDENCRYSEDCNYDGDDCICDEYNDNSLCDDLYTYFSIVANSDTADDKVTMNELCSYWDYIEYFDYEGFEKWVDQECNATFIENDINNDGVITLNEMLVAFHDFVGISIQEAMQVNCTVCLQSGFGV